MAFIQFIKTIECAQSVYNTRNFMQVFVFFFNWISIKSRATAVATDEIVFAQQPLYSSALKVEPLYSRLID